MNLGVVSLPEREFPISRDPPEGGTSERLPYWQPFYFCFQFLGIPPKGEQGEVSRASLDLAHVSNF